MRIRLNKAHYPVTALGPGNRIGIWMQGCDRGCPSCISRDTWEADSGTELPVSMLLEWCREITLGHLDGVTISGGEPFQQPVALSALLDGLRAWRDECALPFDILCYSGLPYRLLIKYHGHILEKLDVVIPEPFIEDLPKGNSWSGSANQPLITLTDIGRKKYTTFLEGGTIWPKRFQTSVSNGRIWYIGIPDRGDMELLEDMCRERGLTLKASSWRA